jgi:hypothetical protein
MNRMPVEPIVDLEGVLALDRAARATAREMIEA